MIRRASKLVRSVLPTPIPSSTYLMYLYGYNLIFWRWLQSAGRPKKNKTFIPLFKVGNTRKWLPHPINFCSFCWYLLSVLFPLLILTWKEASSYATTLSLIKWHPLIWILIGCVLIEMGRYLPTRKFRNIDTSHLLHFRKVMSRGKKLLTSTIHINVVYESDRDLSERVIQSDSLNLFRTCYASIMQHQ